MNFFISFIFSFVFLQSSSLSEIRNSYINASESKNNSEKFFTLLSNTKSEKSTYIAYKGASIVLKSKFETNKNKKKELFIEGITLVEKAIKKDINNIEIRLVRLSIQENTPKILKYKANISEDKKLIVSNFESQTIDLKDYIRTYAKRSKSFTQLELNKINK